MGSSSSAPIIYGQFIGKAKPGETPIIRNPIIGEGPLREINEYKVRTIWEAVENTITNLGKANSPCLGSRPRTGKDQYAMNYHWKTYQEIYDESLNFAKGCAGLNGTPEVKTERDGNFKFLGIFSRNREEWIISDLASHANGVTVVTIYDTLGDQAIEFILNQTKLITLVVEAKGLKKILELAQAKKVGKGYNIIALDKEDEIALVPEFKKIGIYVYSFEDIVNKGKGQTVKLTPSKPETICTICYTSGTTGLPKGAMISHKAGLAEIDILDSVGFTLSNDIYLSFLPLAHIMERLIITVIGSHGVQVGFYSGNPLRLVEDAKILQPTVICGVPRIFQRIYEAIQANISSGGFIQRALVDKGIRTKLEEYRNTGSLQNCLWDSLVFNKMKNILGGKIRFMLIGAAPMSSDILEFLKIAFGSCIIEGYGQTENCAGMLLTRIDDKITGHGGGPGFANEVKLVSVPELDYTVEDKNPDTNIPEPRGEIHIRGPILFSGYGNDVENTAKAIDEDGWLHTGDVGVCLTGHGNAIKIIDRVKNIFKLSQGEYVAPEKLENVLVKSHFVAQIFVYGDSFQNYLVAIVVPRPETCVKVLSEKSISCTKDNVADYYDNEVGKEETLKDGANGGKRSGFKGFEIIKKVFLTKEAFTIENDLCTPTLKIKRHNTKNRYLNEINAMYGLNNETTLRGR